MSRPNDRKACCFGVVETSYISDPPSPARRTRRGSVMVERSSVPRTILINSIPPPAPTTNIYFSPSNCTSATPFPAAPPPQVQVDTTATANAIAELLAPTRAQIRQQVSIESGECQDPARRRDREVQAEVECRLAKDRWIDEEARRVVRERNSRDDRRSAELRQLEENARRRIDQDFRTSNSSLSSGREFTSRERLVVVERPSEGIRNRCENCHEFGHRARDCETTVVVRVEGGRERRKSVSYKPRKQIRYVRGD